MAVASSAADLKNEVAAREERKSRSKCPGVRVIGGRIYDSDNGKTCHQCRQKTRDFAAGCKNQKGDKMCTIKYCHKCLMNRYGEKAEEVSLLDNWKCPRCRGICNCSFCMKKRGHKPTGILVHTAKENGFSSVSELLQVKGAENFSYDRIAKDVGVSSKNSASSKESMIASPRKPGKENSFDGKIDLTSHSQSKTPISVEKKTEKKRREGLQELSNGDRDDDPSLGKSSKKKTRITDENSKNKVKIKEKLKKNKNNGVTMEEMKSMTQAQVAPSKEVMMNGTTERCDFAETEKFKAQMSKDVVCLSTNNEKDAGKYKNVVVSIGVQNDNLETKSKKATKSCKINKCIIEFQSKQIDDDIPLPLATCLTTVAGIELPNEIAGDALQFFEFCAAFSEVLYLKKGQAEAVIREIIFGRGGRRSQGSLLVQLNIKLLSLILEDIGQRSPTLSVANDKTSWVKALGKCVSNCNFLSEEFPSDCFDRGNERYDMLNAPQKFKLLNFLCDEALNTKDLRNWIDDQNSKFVESEKEAKEKYLAAKDKEKHLKQKVKYEVAKVIIAKHGATLSVSEHEEIVSQIKKEAAQAHAEMLEAMGMAPKRRHRSDAVRTDPILLDVNGRAFWRLKGYKDESDILLQDMGTWNLVAPEDKWFVYDAEQKEGIEKYISSLRTKRLRSQKS